MRAGERFEWWIDESSLPDVIWALLRSRPDGSAEVLDADGRTSRFDSWEQGVITLSEDEYVRARSLEVDELARLGMVHTDLAVPSGDTDAELVSQMRRLLACAEALRDLSAVEWQDPWVLLSPSERDSLEDELRRELSVTHPLQGRDARALLRRSDCDDVLFVMSHPVELAVVHLTYTQGLAEKSPWPMAETYDEVWKFVDQTHRDAADYDAG